jgi:hypothetical protein
MAGLLEKVAALDAEIKKASDALDELKATREQYAAKAVEEMQLARVDGVKVAGRSWRVSYDHFASVPKEKQEEVLEAAKKAGLLDEVRSVNTAGLKSLLKEMAAGRDARELFSTGTVFEGLVSEYVQPVLRHVTTR